VVLGAGEEQVAVPVVLEEGERALVPLHENRPHLAACCCSPPPPPPEREEEGRVRAAGSCVAAERETLAARGQVAFVWDGKPVRLLAVLSTLLGPGLAQTRITGWLKYGLHSHHDDDGSEAQKVGILTRVLHGSGSFLTNLIFLYHRPIL
jgi:hypothetical protein